MEISRHGSQRDRGTKDLIDNVPLILGSESRWQDNVSWHPYAKQIVINVSWVLATDGHTHHDYSIRLSLEDVSALVTILGHAGSASDAQLLRDHLNKQVPALVKLLACATGLVPTPMAEQTSPTGK